MKIKARLIKENLAGLRVLDIGGSGCREGNACEAEPAAAWAVCKTRARKVQEGGAS